MCHMVSLPLTSSLSFYISDKPKSKTLLTILTLLRLHTRYMKGRKIGDRKPWGRAITRFRYVVISVHLSYFNSCVVRTDIKVE